MGVEQAQLAVLHFVARPAVNTAAFHGLGELQDHAVRRGTDMPLYPCPGGHGAEAIAQFIEQRRRGLYLLFILGPGTAAQRPKHRLEMLLVLATQIQPTAQRRETLGRQVDLGTLGIAVDQPLVGLDVQVQGAGPENR